MTIPYVHSTDDDTLERGGYLTYAGGVIGQPNVPNDRSIQYRTTR